MAGFGAIELWFSDVDAHLAAGGSLTNLRDALDAMGLEVPTLIYFSGWFDCDDAQWPQIQEDCARRMEQAAQLGASRLICSPPAGPADLALGAQRYRELLDLGDTIGVAPIFEFLGFVKRYCTIDSALEVLTRAGGGTTVVDPFHLIRGGDTLDSISHLTGAQIAISHFNDTVAHPPPMEQHDGDRVMPGDGCLDLHRYCELLRGTGYRGWLSLELFRPDLWARDPLEVAREGRRKMQPFIGG